MLKIAKITMFSIMFKQNFLLKVIKNILSVKNKEDFQPQYIYIFFETKGNTYICHNTCFRFPPYNIRDICIYIK